MYGTNLPNFWSKMTHQIGPEDYVVLLIDAQKAYWRKPNGIDSFKYDKCIATNYSFEYKCSTWESYKLNQPPYDAPHYSSYPHYTAPIDSSHQVFHATKKFPILVSMTATAKPWDKLVLTKSQYELLFNV